MPAAKLGLVDYISRNPFAKIKKISSYDEDFVVTTIANFRDPFIHLIKQKLLTVQKLDSILELHYPYEHQVSLSHFKHLM